MSILSWKDELLKRKLQKPKKGDSDWQKEGQYTAEIASLTASKKKVKKVTDKSNQNTVDLYALYSGEIGGIVGENVKGFKLNTRFGVEDKILDMFFPNLEKDEKKIKMEALMDAREKLNATAEQEEEKLEAKKLKNIAKLTKDYLDNLSRNESMIGKKK